MNDELWPKLRGLDHGERRAIVTVLLELAFEAFEDNALAKSELLAGKMALVKRGEK
jgi:hypothetical protein